MDENIDLQPKFVIDASVVLARLLPDEKLSEINKKYFDDFQKGDIVFLAPTLLNYEVINGLKSALLQKRLTLESANELLKSFIDWKIPCINIHLSKVLKLAVDKNISSYDASYVYLAHENNCPLLTLDDKLV